MLVLVRHGQTHWNAEGRMQGQQDTELSPLGREQARRNGERLADLLPAAVEFEFLASPLQRARVSMELLRAAMGLDPAGYAVDDRLKEVSMGDWETYTVPELHARFGQDFADREADKWGYQPPRGESYAQLADRVRWLLEPGERGRVVVSHGGVMRILTGMLTGMDLREAPNLDIPQDRFFIWDEGVGRWV